MNGTGLTQRELARRVGLTARQLYRYEHRTKLPEPVRRLFLLAAALGVSADELIQPDVMAALRTEVKAREAEAGPT
ncbi:MAG: helix-turn-helix transcriptional regulator [Myxococcales bacterium]|nr:helix-turn-helix transcriptional regulator [Myxococcales bacterium]